MRVKLVLAAAFAIAGCDRNSDPPLLEPETALATVASSDTTRYLPYGVPIPRDQVLTAVPEPYDADKHGPPLPNTRPDSNVVQTKRVRLPSVPRVLEDGLLSPMAMTDRVPSVPPGDGDHGWYLDYVAFPNSTGVYASNDAQADFEIPISVDSAVIYAPTHLAPDNACIEMTTIHWRYPEFTVTLHGQGWWDWCASTYDFQTFELMTPQWRQAYTRMMSTDWRPLEEVMYAQVFRGGSICWSGLLYNFDVGMYEEKAFSCGTGPFRDGWTKWESYYLMDNGCGFSFPGISAFAVYIMDNEGPWTSLADVYTRETPARGACWTSGEWIIQKENRGWRAYTPRNP